MPSRLPLNPGFRSTAPPPLTRRRRLLAALFVATGLLHFIAPRSYQAVAPAWLPWHAALMAVSGAAEIAGGLGVLVAPLRRAAGWGLIALSIAV
ncbi:DoxX family protein [Massilia sp. DWR3-1-1]|uniref:DoxX family protein n=1 Tax=Massilia sp. DWR3-1-1 TaxID=2804559 RepID=UPI003CF4B334